MIDAESVYLRLCDHYQAYARLWTPPEPKGAVLYLHGIQSHGRWFEHSAARIAEAGYTVLLPDRRGSGRNEVERGHTPSARQLLRDGANFLDELHVRTGQSRFHIVGVSWGGKWAMALARYAPQRIAGISLVAPGLFSRVDLPTVAKFRVAMSAVAAPRAYFDIPLNDPELFTANRERQDFINNDPLALRRVTTRFLLASRKLDGYVRGLSGRKANIPIHLMLAGRDRIIANEKTRRFIEQLHWPNTKITEYPDAQHTLEFEPDPEPFIRDLIEGLETQVATTMS